MLLSDADVAQMRSTVNTSLGGTAVIQTRGFTDDSGGGGTLAWSNAGTVACRLSSLTGGERELANRIAEDAQWLLTIPTSGTITTDSRFIVTGTGHDGTYEALAVRAWTPSVSKRIEVREVV